MKHPVKFATLNKGVLFDNGSVRYIGKQENAYLTLMGKEPPELYPPGTVGYEQFRWRPGSKRSAEDLASPKAKPTKKAAPARRARREVVA